MQIKLSFLGAAQNVTGSRFLVEVDGAKVLVDCGLYQERKLRDRNWDRFPVPPKDIDAVVLTHAHLDHVGYLPKLVKDGFGGKVFCTEATAEIAQIIMLDSGKIQEEDAAYKRKRHLREGRTPPRPVVPLYTVEDAKKVENRYEPVEYGRTVEVARGISALFCDAGHVLGSANVRLRISSNGDHRTILFSGDVGRKDRPIIEDPDHPDGADYVLIESTYGDRVHRTRGEVTEELAKAVNETFEAGGNLIIPAFALERSQELLYHFHGLVLDKRIPEMLVFLDSPMAIRITEVFKRHPELFDDEMTQRMGHKSSPFDFPGLRMTETANESKAINPIRGGVAIIAGSGMCTGGRVKHHLINNITRPESMILFVGYQAIGTLGRLIVDRREEVRIHGRMLPVRAKVRQVRGLSAHADRNELLEWLRSLKHAPREVFIVHGESAEADHFRDFLADKTGWKASVPAYKHSVKLD